MEASHRTRRLFDDVAVDQDVVICGRDGTELNTDLFRPVSNGTVIDEPLPVLLCRTPYGKARYAHEGMYLARHGYVVAIQDWRQTQGKFDSKQFRPKYEATDGYDVIEWLAAQPFCDGQVGMWGHSAMGQTIQGVLATRPPSLASAYIIDSGLNYGSYPARMNGAFGMAFRLRHTLLMAKLLETDPDVRRTLEDAYLHPDKYFSIFSRPHAPVTRGTTVLALSPPLEDRYLRTATTDDLDDPFWKDSGKSDEELIVEWKDIPVCFSSGWYGNHLSANVDKFRILSAQNSSPVRMIVGHWEHRMTATSAGAVDFGSEATMDIFGSRRVEWFDQTLKGMDTGLFDKPPVEYFVMGGGAGTVNADGRLNHGGHWAATATWPPTGAQQVPYYLHADMSLSPAAPQVKSGHDGSTTTYTFDPRDPVPTMGGNFMEYTRPDYADPVSWMADGGAQDQRANASKPFCRDNLPLATREDVLVFQTQPLEQDIEVSGELLARLWVSSTAPDTDFTVKLIDVHPPSRSFPEGFAMNLQDAVVRMRYRNGRRKPELITPGEIYEIELPFHSTSNLFKAGHRIRFDVSSSNFPRIDVNPNTGGPQGIPGPVHTADNTIHHDTDHPSQVILPIVTTNQIPT